MEIAYTKQAKDDIAFWKSSGNPKVMKKIQSLIQDIILHPIEGIGKPEALKHSLKGLWSRRIDKEHRIIYSVEKVLITIHSLKGHYED